MPIAGRGKPTIGWHSGKLTSAGLTGASHFGAGLDSRHCPCGRSGLRDHKHNGHGSERDAADCEHPDGAEPQRYVTAG